MNTRSIHVRLILWYTALVIFIAAGFGAYTYQSLEERLYGELRHMLTHRLEHLRDDILPGLTSHASQNLSREIQEVYSPEENDRFIRISKPDGTILYISGKPYDQSFNPDRIALPKDYTGVISEPMLGLRSREHLLLVGFVTNLAGEDYVLEMGAPTQAIAGALRKLAITLLIGLPFMIAIAVIGGAILIKRAMQPVETIRATAEQITFSNPHQRLPVTPTGDELEHLSVTLNQMLQRLDQAYQQASRFSADASHELRTPLAIMRSELESIATTMRTWQLPVELRERLGSALEETERLSGIVEKLFAIARLDAGEAKTEHKIFDVVELVRSTIEQMQLLIDDKNLSISIQASQPVFISGDAARMKQVIVNLLDNAIKYTMPGGTITFSIYTSGMKAFLSIMDNGIGIPPDALPYIFERFYRADKARNSQGAGLGLSIVRAICHAHGGSVDVSSSEGSGTTITIELPLANAEGTKNAA